MTRTITAALVSAFLLAGPAFAEEAGKSKKKETRADGTEVETKTKKDWKADGTGEAKTETTVTDPATGAESKKAAKVKKSKNADGQIETQTEVKKESKK